MATHNQPAKALPGWLVPLRDVVVPPARRIWRRVRAVPLWVKQAAVAIAVVVVAAVSLAALGIYTMGWQDPFTGVVSAVVPFPAFSVDSVTVSYHAYYRQLQAYNYTNRQLGDRLYPQSAINQQAFDTLKRQAVLQEFANQNGLTVSDAELNDALDNFYSSQGGKASALAQAKHNYGWDAGQLTDQLRYQILTLKALKVAAADPARLQTVMNRAVGLIGQLQGGTDMDALAAKYSSDSTGRLKGDQALVPASSLPAAAEAAANTLGDGRLDAQPVSANGAVYIIKRVRTSDHQAMVRLIKLPVIDQMQWQASRESQAKVVQLLPQL